jgi:hypothetical protein
VNPEQVRERESRWALPAALGAFLTVALLVMSRFVDVNGSEDREALRSAHAHAGAVTTSGLLQTLAFLALIVPLVYLFQAARARSPRMRPQMIGLVVVAPLFLALSGALAINVRHEAADQFVSGQAKSTLSKQEARKECKAEEKEEGRKAFAEEAEAEAGETPLAACERKKRENDEAANALSEASLTPATSVLGIAGVFGLVVSLFYTCLWAMRAGLLTRFWGSLGMAAGITFLLGPLLIIALVWIVGLGFVLLGWTPGGKPPAWKEGKAVPWQTPGERAAAELEPAEGVEAPQAEPVEAPEPKTAPEEPGERRKRKQRE